MSEFSEQRRIDVEAAHILIFHPDDMVHTVAWPIAWYCDSAVYPHESEAQRLIAWCTMGDSVHDVRLTNGALTEREKAYAGPSWTFPYRVRHGRVFLDNSDVLPSQEQMASAEERSQYWVDVPNGDYAVSITAVDWTREPGADEEGFDALPDYVVQFAPMDGSLIAIAKRPPDIVAHGERRRASDELYRSEAVPVNIVEPEDISKIYPAFVSANLVGVGGKFYSKNEAPIDAIVAPGEDDWESDIDEFIVGERVEPGAEAMVCERRGRSWTRGEGTTYSFKVLRAVRIASIDGVFDKGQLRPLKKTGLIFKQTEEKPADALYAVRIKAWEPDPDIAPTVSAEEMRRVIIADLESGGYLGQQIQGLALHEILQLRQKEHVGQFANWLIEFLPLDGSEKLSMSKLQTNARAEAVMQAYHRLAGD